MGDVAVGLLPPPLLQRSFSRAALILSTGATALSPRGLSFQATSLFQRFPLLALERRCCAVQEFLRQARRQLGAFFLAGQILSSNCSKLYSCVSFRSISAVRSLHPCQVNSMYARPSFFVEIFECCGAGFLIEVLSVHEWFVSGS